MNAHHKIDKIVEIDGCDGIVKIDLEKYPGVRILLTKEEVETTRKGNSNTMVTGDNDSMEVTGDNA